MRHYTDIKDTKITFPLTTFNRSQLKNMNKLRVAQKCNDIENDWIICVFVELISRTMRKTW